MVYVKRIKIKEISNDINEPVVETVIEDSDFSEQELA